MSDSHADAGRGHTQGTVSTKAQTQHSVDKRAASIQQRGIYSNVCIVARWFHHKFHQTVLAALCEGGVVVGDAAMVSEMQA